MCYAFVILSAILILQTAPIQGQDTNPGKTTSLKSSVSPYFSDYQHDYDVKFYFIDLEVNDKNSFIRGKTQIIVESLPAISDKLVFELDSRLTIDSVVVNSITITEFTSGNNLLQINLPAILNHEKIYTAEIYYEGTAGSQGFFGGVMSRRDYSYDKTVSYTLSEPYQTMLWFPCKQDLRDKADSAWVFLTVEKGLKAGSNGLLTQITSTDSTDRFEWKTKYPVAYYLLSFAVSDYIDYSFHVSLPGIKDSLLVQNYIYNHPSVMANEKEDIDKTRELLLLYTDLLGVYPFYNEKYGHCMAPMGGGMEHQTMTTLSTFNFELVAHELAHQWYGNYVTCKTWQDIWINEGFASYLEYVAVEKLGEAEDAESWMINAQNNSKKHNEGSVYIPADDIQNVNRLFNVDLSYKKGATILHMLRYEINDDDVFFKVLREFLHEFAFGTATGDDFLNTLNRITAKDFTWFFQQWYYGKGFPIFVTSWKQYEDSLIISCSQETSSFETPFFQTHMDFKIIYFDNTTETIRVLFETNNHMFPVKTNKAVATIIADPENKVLKSSVIHEQYPADQIFNASPNPFTRNLFIKFANGIKTRTLRLNRLEGYTVFETSTVSDYINLDLGFLGDGIYILTIMEDGREYPLRIVKIGEK